MRIYVGNLSSQATDADLTTLFSPYGQVIKAEIVKDYLTRWSREFGFVDMPDAAEAKAAINALDGREVQGRALKVNEATDRGDAARTRNGGAHPGGNGAGRQGPRPGN